MDIEIHGSVKEIGVSRPEEFRRKFINLKGCKYIKIYPRGSDKTEDFIEIEIDNRVKKVKLKRNRIKTIYKLRLSRPMKIRPEVSNSIYIDTVGYDE